MENVSSNETNNNDLPRIGVLGKDMPRVPETEESFFAAAPSLKTVIGPPVSERIVWILRALYLVQTDAELAREIIDRAEAERLPPPERVEAIRAALSWLTKMDRDLDAIRHEVRNAITRRAHDLPGWERIAEEYAQKYGS